MLIRSSSGEKELEMVAENTAHNGVRNGVGHGVIVRDPRTHTSESFCFSKYHGFNNGGPSPVPNLVTSQSNNNLDAVQGTI